MRFDTFCRHTLISSLHVYVEVKQKRGSPRGKCLWRGLHPIIFSGVTFSGIPIPAHGYIDDLFEEITRHCKLDPTMVIDLLDEVNEYWIVMLLNLWTSMWKVPLAQLVWTNQLLRLSTRGIRRNLSPKWQAMAYLLLVSGIRFQVPLTYVTLMPQNPLRGFVTIIKDILWCNIQVPLLPYFERLLEYYSVSLM